MKHILVSIFLLLTSCNKEPLSTNLASPRTLYTISGRVIWEHDLISGVRNITVNLTGPEVQSVITDVNGNFVFTISTLGNYTITPSVPNGFLRLNGVTTADAQAVQQHIALINPIASPYKRIAADVNKSNTITTADAAIINQAINGNPTALNYLNPSWRFVDSSYALTIPPSGVPTGYPQSITVNVVSDTTGLNFIGIKRGDVNGTANPQN